MISYLLWLFTEFRECVFEAMWGGYGWDPARSRSTLCTSQYLSMFNYVLCFCILTSTALCLFNASFFYIVVSVMFMHTFLGYCEEKRKVLWRKEKSVSWLFINKTWTLEAYTRSPDEYAPKTVYFIFCRTESFPLLYTNSLDR